MSITAIIICLMYQNCNIIYTYNKFNPSRAATETSPLISVNKDETKRDKRLELVRVVLVFAVGLL